jgi:hemerythrin
MLVEWKDGYSVQNEVIDTQHKGLLRFTNELYGACQNGGIDEKISFIKTVQEAFNYVKEHFSTEEVMMRDVNYPKYSEHKKEHDAFIAEVLHQVKQLDNIKQIDATPFVFFLRDWVLNHIAVSDTQYMPYAKDWKPSNQ